MWRHSKAREEVIKRIHDGAIGDVNVLRIYRVHGPVRCPAVADKPTGPYVKCKDNPLIGGHTVCIWPHREGLAALIDAAGPERFTVQWSADGIHFKRAAKVPRVHTGCGPFDADAFTNARYGRGIAWGVAQNHEKGTLCIVRFDVDLRAPKKARP